MKSVKSILICALGVLPALGVLCAAEARPNIVYILADDLGYGDVSCYNEQSKLATPRIDRLAAEGIRFTDAHSASACTPTRYAILTGRYAFRSRVPVNVLMAYDPPLIEEGRLTVPALLKQQGYHTACIGKWHLGWDWPFTDADRKTAPDFTRPIANGPITRGFDEYFGTHVPNQPPYAFIQNDRLTVQPTADFSGKNKELHVMQAGPMAPGWKFEEIMPALAARVDDYLRARAADKKPFFLYYTLTIPHEPLAPTPEFLDKSRINRVGDLVLQTDAAVGAVLDSLQKLGLEQNTLVFFASDNGHGPATGVPALLAAGHDPSRPFRGYKGSLLEGGHRVPFVVRWPGKVKAGTTCSEIISLNSLMATSAEILGAKIPLGAGEDSCSILPLLLGQPERYHPVWPAEVHAGVSGMAVRQGRWKLLESKVKNVNPARPDALSGLYDLQSDPAETNNVIAQHAEMATTLKAQLDKIVGQKAAQAQKPNVLLIVADDLGYGDLSAYGCKDFQTPQLDALAASGQRFTAGYVTAPLCSPSRAALLTGRHQSRFLTYGGNPPGPSVGLPLEVRMLAEHLKGAGYRTGALGKWHLGEAEPLQPQSRGFDEFFGFLSGMHDYFKTDDPRWGTILRGRQREELKQYLTFALADEACAFIRQEKPEPFFLYLAFNAPHLPHQAPENYLAKTAHLADPKRRINAAMILALDDAVGRVMEALRQSGRLENTLVFFLSDNGAALIKGSAENGGSNAPLRGSKTQLWEGGVRVPFFVAWKGRIAPGGVTPEPVSTLDVAPTVLAAAGVKVLPEWKLDGLDLLPWLIGESAIPKRGLLYWKFGLNKAAIRDGDMKWVREGQEGGLFNVRRDLSETADQSQARPILARQLQAAWRKWDAANLSSTRLSGAKQTEEPADDGLRERFQFLRIGAVQPRGWLLDQIRVDVTHGYGPVLVKLTERIDPAVFDSRNKTTLVKPKIGGDWWNGETTGNWLDGFIRAAYYSGDAAAMRRVDELVAQFLAMQEPDGYLGIYPGTMRFEQPVVSQNGEFWTLACLCRGLLAYHEFTGRNDVLEAVARAVKLMISKYGPERQYWGERVIRGGPTHNLMFVDVCEWLWHATGDQAYADFARFLYDTYSERADVFESGVQLHNLADTDKLFKGHGAHVMEHLRVPLFVAFSSGDTKYRPAVGNIFSKTDRHLSAGGACISDEDILERLGGPDIGCEYCTMLELLHSLESGVQKTGRASLGDRIEVLAFNSAQGARLRNGKAIQYCTRDNQHEASIAAGKGSRFKLSPTHEDVAVCCPVTALKFFPYLVGGLWLRETNGAGLVAVAYAPNAVTTSLNGATVTVESETAYPFEDEVRMTVRMAAPAQFSLRLRVPAWAGVMNVAAPGAQIRAEPGWRVLSKVWNNGDTVTLAFAPEIVRQAALDGSGVYWQRGPLVYALPIPAQVKKTKDYPVPGFADWDYTPAANAFWDFEVSTNTGHFVFAREQANNAANPWEKSPVAMTGTLLSRKTKQPETVRLVPMGTSLLRHTVFADAASAAGQPSKQSTWLKGDANLARKAEVNVSSVQKGYQRSALIDGVAEGFPKNPAAEWASLRGGAGTKARVIWEMPETVGSVWLFDRPNAADQVLAAKIEFSDGSTAEVGELPNDGAAPFRLNFPAKTITWLEVTVTRVSPQTRNAGFSEIAAFKKDPLSDEP